MLYSPGFSTGCAVAPNSTIVRFGVFEVDVPARELRKQGRRVRLQDKPFELLAILLERRGEIVMRDELRRRLWPTDTYVVFDDSLNTLVRKVRDALGDAADGSKYIETIPRRGYRFIADVASPAPLALSAVADFAFQGPALGGLDSSTDRSRAPDVVQPRSPTRSWLLSTVAGVAIAAIPALIGLRWSMAAPAVLRMVRANAMTTAPGIEHLPSFSPDGSRVAFAADTRGNFDIWVSQLGSEGAIEVSGGYGGHDMNPAWSPDGAWIAFASERDGGGIYVVPAIGGAIRRVAAVSFTPSPDLIGSVPTLAWSPDSSRLAFAHGVDDRAGLWIVSAASGAVRQVPMPPAIRPFSIVQPSWSPDGRRLAFVAQSGSLHTLSQIWSVNQDGTDPIAITDSSNANMHPAWLAGTLFFLSDRAGTLDVYEQPISRYGRRLGDPHAVTTGVGIDSFAISADQRHIVYAKTVERSNIWSTSLGGDADAMWSAARPLAAENQTLESLELSADGRWIVFDSTRRGSSDLWRVNVDGTGLTQITNDAGDEWHPSLSPDGRTVAYHAALNGNREIFTASVGGGERRQLTNHPAKDWLPRWSPDGRSIAFVSDRNGSQDIFLVPSEGGASRALVSDPANDHNPLWALDGRAIYFASNRDGGDELFVIAREGGTPERITYENWDDVVPLSASADGCCVYVWARGQDEPLGFWTVRLDTGSAEPLLRGGFASHQLGVSAATDGRHLFFPVWERSANLWRGELSLGR